MSAGAEIVSSLLLFVLVYGMSATVDIKNIKEALGNRNAILTGLFLQFVILPFLGFAVVKALDMNTAMGISLLVVTSSPGGSYSNWWCSMFNADLALSVTMTAISTLCSVVMLPLNLVIYATTTFEADVVKKLDWVSLFVALVVVISAIGLGLLTSAKIQSATFNLMANKLGNFAGVALVVFSVFASNGPSEERPVSAGDEAVSIWNGGWKFYLGVATPCFLGLVMANVMTTSFRLKQPQRVTVSVECCYQNVGIATSVAITMFKGDELAEAIGVPLYYGIVEAVILGIYCIIAWKVGWTKAPPDEKFCVVIVSSYEVQLAKLEDINAIEVVLGSPKSDMPHDMIFQLDTDYESEKSSVYAISYMRAPSGTETDDDDLEEGRLLKECEFSSPDKILQFEAKDEKALPTSDEVLTSAKDGVCHSKSKSAENDQITSIEDPGSTPSDQSPIIKSMNNSESPLHDAILPEMTSKSIYAGDFPIRSASAKSLQTCKDSESAPSSAADVVDSVPKPKCSAKRSSSLSSQGRLDAKEENISSNRSSCSALDNESCADATPMQHQVVSPQSMRIVSSHHPLSPFSLGGDSRRSISSFVSAETHILSMPGVAADCSTDCISPKHEMHTPLTPGRLAKKHATSPRSFRSPLTIDGASACSPGANDVDDFKSPICNDASICSEEPDDTEELISSAREQEQWPRRLIFTSTRSLNLERKRSIDDNDSTGSSPARISMHKGVFYNKIQG